MGSQQLNQAVDLAYAKVNLAICEATLQALEAVTGKSPDTSTVIAAHYDAYMDAYSELKGEEHRAETDFQSGTNAEWEALTDAEKAGHWEQFHCLCEQGTADQMYFYQVLMNQWLVGYVGH